MSIVSRTRRGAADAVFVLLGLLAVGAVLAALLFLGADQEGPLEAVENTPVAAQEPPAGSANSASQAQPETLRVGDMDLPGAAMTRAGAGIEVGGNDHWRKLDKVFDGQGTISGSVQGAPGVTFPEQWELVVEPSLYVVGRKRAVTRILELPGNQRTFEVRDLPMGAYRVYARAPGLNCGPQEVSLYKVKGYESAPGNNHARVMLQLTPAGFLDGSVVDEDGQPVEGLLVTLERITTTERRETKTTPAGLYAFENVLDGKYKLLFGPPNQPLIDDQELLFKAPEHNHPEVTIPRLASVEIEVVDEFARGIPLAKVRGFGPVPIDVETDVNGIAILQFLPAGRYKVRVDASSSGLDRHGKMDFALKGDEVLKAVQITCRQ